MRAPGGAPLAWVWGARGRALSHPRPLVRSRVWPGPSTHWLWVRGVRAWGPVTNFTARALTSWLCALWPLGRAAGAHYPLAFAAGGAGVGTRHQPHSGHSLGCLLCGCGGGTRAPGEGDSCLGVGLGGRALSQPRPLVLSGVRRRPASHWPWVRCAGLGARLSLAPSPVPRFVVCCARFPGSLILDPLRGEALPLVMEVYGWLGLASSGTTRGMRNRPFDAVLLRRDGGNREVPPEGPGGPRGSREGPPGRGSGWVARQGADVAGVPGGGGRRSASRMRRPKTGSPGPCATPTPTGATTGRTRRRRSLSPQTSGGAGDGRARQRWSRALGAGGSGRASDAGHPPGRPGPPDAERPPLPPAVSATEGRAPPPGEKRAGAASARTRAARRPHCSADRQSLTADPDVHPQHPSALPPLQPHRYHAARRQQRREREARG